MERGPRHARRRLAFLAGLALIVGGCTATDGKPSATAAPSSSPATSDAADRQSAPPASMPAATASDRAPLANDPLHALVLRDVRDGTELTLGELAAEKPVLVEMMAIWCTNCRAQMHRVVEAHEQADFHSIGIDVDPSENPDDLKEYVEAQGFDWPFAMADAEIANQLRDRFDNGFLFPPNTPMVLLSTDGSVRALDFGGYSVEELVAEIAAA